jgi:hypothetical protein
MSNKLQKKIRKNIRKKENEVFLNVLKTMQSFDFFTRFKLCVYILFGSLK